MLLFKTAGESHGKGLLVIVDGLPAGVGVDITAINSKLRRRQGGYGRGGRMKIEQDEIEVISGLRGGKTIGSPVGMLIKNRDWQNWQQIMDPVNSKEGKDNSDQTDRAVVTRPRPGHADLAGALKYNTHDIRNILERASARETAARTAAGGLTDCLLSYFSIEIVSHVLQIGEIRADEPEVSMDVLKEKVLDSPLHCCDDIMEKEMMRYIDNAREKGDSLGGVIEVRTTSLPPGLGSHTDWEKRLDGQLAQALMSIPAIKGVEIGPAFANAAARGSRVHDQIYYSNEKGFYHRTNRAGGLEGGMTNGEPLVIRLAMKPIPTLYQPLQSVDLESKQAFTASIERSDVTAVPAAGVVAEAMVSFVLARAVLEKFGGDSITETTDNYQRYLENCEVF